MIARAGSGWQTVLADLSLILFMVTASALQQAQDQPAAAAAPAPPASFPALAEPVAVWRAGGEPLARWLAQQNPDPRQRLTIVAHYADDPEAAGRAALDLARSAGRPARIVLEGDGASGVSAALTYDAGEGRMAQALQR